MDTMAMALLNLYAGQRDESCLDVLIRQQIHEDIGIIVLGRCRSKDHDMLQPELYNIGNLWTCVRQLATSHDCKKSRLE